MNTFESTHPAAPEMVSESVVVKASLIGCWAELREHLERRGQTLSGEVRYYSALIVHCDEQFPLLLEQRDRVRHTVRQMAAADPPRPQSLEWLEHVEAFLARFEPVPDDEAAIALQSRLRALVGAARSA